jgi:hypothetical protein
LQAQQLDALTVWHYVQARVEHVEEASGALHLTVGCALSTKDLQTQQPDSLAALHYAQARVELSEVAANGHAQ